MASCQMILEYGLYISSPGWWHEDEFLLHLVGENKGKVSRHIVASVEDTKYVEPFQSIVGLCMDVLECMMFMYECVGMYNVYVD